MLWLLDCKWNIKNFCSTGSEKNKLYFFRICLHHLFNYYVCTTRLLIDAINWFLILSILMMNSGAKWTLTKNIILNFYREYLVVTKLWCPSGLAGYWHDYVSNYTDYMISSFCDIFCFISSCIFQCWVSISFIYIWMVILILFIISVCLIKFEMICFNFQVHLFFCVRCSNCFIFLYYSSVYCPGPMSPMGATFLKSQSKTGEVRGRSAAQLDWGIAAMKPVWQIIRTSIPGNSTRKDHSLASTIQTPGKIFHRNQMLK